MARVDIKLGYSCNSACLHCVVDDYRDHLRSRGRPQDLTTEEYRRELEDSRRRGCDECVFTGGEPTVRRDLCELLATARGLGYRVILQTNGRRLSRAAYAERVVQAAGPGAFYVVALHASTARVHDDITDRRGSFRQTVEGIRNLVCRGAAVCGKVVIQRKNLGLLCDTCRLLSRLGVAHISLTFPHALGAARRYFDQVVPRYAECWREIAAGIDTCRRLGVSVETEAVPFCFLPGREEAANELRQARESYVELKQYGADRGVVNWSRERLRIKAKGPECRHCRFDPVCEGPWREYPERYGWEEFVPVPGPRVYTVEEVLQGRHRPGPPEESTVPAAAIPFCR